MAIYRYVRLDSSPRVADGDCTYGCR